MPHEIGTPTISRETLSKWLFFLIPIIASVAFTWTGLQLSLQDIRRDVEILKTDAAEQKKIREKATSDQLQQLQQANEKLQEILNTRSVEVQKKRNESKIN